MYLDIYTNYTCYQKIYKDISILDVNDLKSESVTTDIEILSKQMQKFVEIN